MSSRSCRRSTGHGRGSSSGRHPQGRVRPHGRRRAEGLDGGRSALRGPGGVPRRGLARGPRPRVGGAFHELVRPAGPALRRRWKEWEPVGSDFTYAGVPGTHQWYDGTPHPWEFARVWHLEPSADRPGHRARGRRGRGVVPVGRRRQHLAGAPRPARARLRAALAARRGRHVPAHDPARPARPRPDARRDLGGRRVPHRRRRRDLAADQRGPASARASRTRTPRSATASTSWPCTPTGPTPLFMQKHWDVMRTDDGGEHWHEVSGNLPTDFGFADRRARPRAGDRLRRADHQRRRALPAGGQAARLPQPHRRGRVGAADEGTAAGALLRQRAARRDGGRRARLVRRLLRDDRRAGLRVGRRGRHWAPIVRDLPAVLSVEVQTLP